MRATTLLLVALAACVDPPDAGGGDTDREPSDPDVHGGDTGDTSPAAHTDEPTDSDDPPDTDVPPEPDDTYVYVDTSDTGAPPPPPLIGSTIPNVQQGLHAPGQPLRISGVVVTAVREVISPVASNGFTVQDLTARRHGGLYVHVADARGLPAVGSLVDLVGEYQKWPVSPSAGASSQSRLVIGTSGSFTVVGTAPVPVPVELSASTLAVAAQADRYESMLVRLAPAGGLTVRSAPNVYRDFRARDEDTSVELTVVGWFFDLSTVHGVSQGDSLASLTGVLYQRIGVNTVAPRSASDAVDYVDR